MSEHHPLNNSQLTLILYNTSRPQGTHLCQYQNPVRFKAQ